jgi:hypothetical protein
MNARHATVLISMLFVAGAVSAASSAQAAEQDHWSDSAYLTASQCAGLAKGSKMDTAKLDAKLKKQGGWRVGYISDRADDLRAEAQKRARDAAGDQRQAVDAQLAGECQTYLKD